MKITLDTPDLLEDLLAHLREQGCIAYLDEDARCLYAVPPEGGALTPLLDSWSKEAGIGYRLSD